MENSIINPKLDVVVSNEMTRKEFLEKNKEVIDFIEKWTAENERIDLCHSLAFLCCILLVCSKSYFFLIL